MRHTPLLIGDEITAKQVNAKVNGVRRQANRALTIAIIALLLFGTFFGLLLYYGIHYGNLIQSNANIAYNQNQLLKSEVYEALMNISSNYNSTIVQTGTFDWFPGPVSSTYYIEHVQIGPLGFDVVTFNPPSTPLPTSSSIWTFEMRNFVPIINQIILIPQGDPGMGGTFGPSLLRMTSSNAAKMDVSNGCLVNSYNGIGAIPVNSCVESGTSSDYGLTPGLNALRVDRTSFNVASTYFLYGTIVSNPSSLLVGQTFTITSPWQFVF